MKETNKYFIVRLVDSTAQEYIRRATSTTLRSGVLCFSANDESSPKAKERLIGGYTSTGFASRHIYAKAFELHVSLQSLFTEFLWLETLLKDINHL